MKRYVYILSVVVLGIALGFIHAGCQRREPTEGFREESRGEDVPMGTVADLERLLAEANWSAADQAVVLGESAWPVIKNAAQMSDYRSRQIAMVCAARIGGDTAGIILGQGLSDQNVNVRLAAAAQLSVNPPETAKNAVLETLSESDETDVREMLALAAGYLPGERTLEILQSLTGDDDAVARSARMALARLGDGEARAEIVENLSAGEPGIRYEALGQLRYINDVALAEHARNLLSDKENAKRVGPQRRRQYRRVCDQAVDTLAYLLELSLPFETGPEKIYSDEELAQVRAKTG